MFMFTLGYNLWNLAFFCYNFNKLSYLLTYLLFGNNATDECAKLLQQ